MFMLCMWSQMMDYPRHPSAASSALVELTTRLDFFKERRSQLMEQLHNLDLNYGTTSSQDFIYRPSSPPWNWQKTIWCSPASQCGCCTFFQNCIYLYVVNCLLNFNILSSFFTSLYIYLVRIWLDSNLLFPSQHCHAFCCCKKVSLVNS